MDRMRVFAILLISLAAGAVNASEYADAPFGQTWQFPQKIRTFRKKVCGRDVKYCVGFGKIRMNNGITGTQMVVCRANIEHDCPVIMEDCGENDNTIAFSETTVAGAMNGGGQSGGSGSQSGKID